MKPSDFIHPEDAAALRQMEGIPGFAAIVKKILSIGIETLQYGMNMASTIRLSEKQMPELYHHLPPICKKMGIPEPEFYLQMSPVPNAWTSGDTRIYITVTSGLVEMMNEKELDSVIAHECGHILCRHVLYHTVARWLSSGLANLGILGTLAIPVQYALCYWSRKSELSADRAASIITSPEIVASTMARLSGGPKSITANIDLNEWAKQADEYDKIQNDGLWNKALQLSVIAGLDHPFSAVRVREILKWGDSEQYRIIKNGGIPTNGSANSTCCPMCGASIQNGWKFCRNCGQKL
ncbi:M48 family metallopeptidase [uncultured Prevotella sp.]|uniref:M48 family metallopeptidase n=1 Tax=uncultured Prevotella sp. TaxID=159272 RepID=UPI0025CBE20A|nr:M48 family metallopeptidase [uncultured Prevotella sp.]